MKNGGVRCLPWRVRGGREGDVHIEPFVADLLVVQTRDGETCIVLARQLDDAEQRLVRIDDHAHAE